jgi:hypothetical protein
MGLCDWHRYDFSYQSRSSTASEGAEMALTNDKRAYKALSIELFALLIHHIEE